LNPPRDIRLSSPIGDLAALHWPNPGAPRVLCLHGWLDNAASFIPLNASLKGLDPVGLDLVALDFAGHGYSSHRPAGSRYYLHDYLWDVEAALDALDWDAADIIGHSLGGVIAGLYAAASPERINRLVLLDGLGPPTAGSGQSVERLRRSMASTRKPESTLRRYQSIDEAARARQKVTPMSDAAVRLLVERAIGSQDDHFRWRTDPRLNWHSPFLMTEEQVLELLAGIEAPSLSIVATPIAHWFKPQQVEKRMAALPRAQHQTIEGHHHFHMEQPGDIAPMIQAFLQTENHHE
jgi:pimeloyl-ACP methyl ester carboxylesterase